MTTTTIEPSNFIQRLVLNKWAWFFFCGFFFIYPIYRAFNRELPPEKAVISRVEEFSMTSDQGEAFGSQQLSGKVYIASFSCLDCQGSDELLASIQKIQKRVRGLTTSVAIITFTTQPEKDTTEKLFKKGREVHTNPFVWKFLTHPSWTNLEMAQFLSENFQVHSLVASKFAIVDVNGGIRGYYKNNKNDINTMMIDLGLLINRSKLNFKR